MVVGVRGGIGFVRDDLSMTIEVRTHRPLRLLLVARAVEPIHVGLRRKRVDFAAEWISYIRPRF